ncbi:MAG: type IX secretion system membrane protein PorP/SprF [Bacteroidales bacterium]|nr:type IX secretion system membrane protein PorP/SprF [Bacteroidales bacterium]
MFRIVRFIIVSLFAVAWVVTQAQDPEFSQFYANPLYLNPALAGSTECGRLGLNYRNQYPSLSNAFVTYNLSYDQSLPGINSGYGVLAMSDAQGDGALVRNSVSAFFSYKLQVSDPVMVSFGIKAGYYQEHLNWGKLIFADQINPTTGNVNPVSADTPPTSNNISAIDFSAGAIMSYLDQFFFGVAVDHLNQPNLSFYNTSDSKWPMKIAFHGGAVINATNGGLGNASVGDIMIQPNLLYMQQGEFHQLNVGMYFNKYPFVLGGWFRHNFENPDAVVALVGFTYNNIRIGYSFDFTVSNIGGKAGGAHEISFAWDFCLYKEASRRHIRAIKSPSF